MRGVLAGVLVTAILAAVSCAPAKAVHESAPPPSLPAVVCRTTTTSPSPLVVEWPPAERLALESQAARGTVVVHYAGCNLEVLRKCHAPGAYRFGAATHKDNHLAIRTADELHANLPAHASQLEEKLRRAGRLDVDLSVIGAWISDTTDVHASKLEGDCAGATHVATVLTVGAFELGTADDAKEVLSRAGTRESCANARSDATKPPEECGAVLRLDLHPISGLAGAGPTRCKIDLGPAKCPRVPTVLASFDDAWDFADVKPERCERRAKDWFNYCGGSEPVTAHFYKDGTVTHEATYAAATHCAVTLRDCPRQPELVGTFNDDFESVATDEARCLQRADDFWLFCGGAQPVTAQFLTGAKVGAERTSNHATRCQIVNPECPRNKRLSGTFNDAHDGSDKGVERCMKRAKEFVAFCGGPGPVTAGFFDGAKLVREVKATLASRCQITLPECPQQPELAGVFNDDFEGANTKSERCLRRSDDFREHCSTGTPVIARFFRGDTAVAERTAAPPTRCEVTSSACPNHPLSAGTFNDSFQGANADPVRCAGRAAELARWCGGGTHVVRFFRGSVVEREQRSEQ